MVAFWFSVYKLRSWKFCFSHSEHIAKLNTYLGDMPTMEEHQALQEQASTLTSLVPKSPPGMRLYGTPTGLVPRSPPGMRLYGTLTGLVPRSPPGMRLYSTPTSLVPKPPPRVSLYMYTIGHQPGHH